MGAQMKEYIIVYTHHHQDLADEVNKFMALGYTPIGNPYIAPDHRLSQAMILTNRKTPEQAVIKVAKVKQPKEK
jgi:hypothetical protein